MDTTYIDYSYSTLADASSAALSEAVTEHCYREVVTRRGRYGINRDPELAERLPRGVRIVAVADPFLRQVMTYDAWRTV